MQGEMSQLQVNMKFFTCWKLEAQYEREKNVISDHLIHKYIFWVWWVNGAGGGGRGGGCNAAKQIFTQGRNGVCCRQSNTCQKNKKNKTKPKKKNRCCKSQICPVLQLMASLRGASATSRPTTEIRLSSKTFHRQHRCGFACSNCK